VEYYVRECREINRIVYIILRKEEIIKKLSELEEYKGKVLRRL